MHATWPARQLEARLEAAARASWHSSPICGCPRPLARPVTRGCGLASTARDGFPLPHHPTHPMSMRRKMRGLGLPGWGSGVTEPAQRELRAGWGPGVQAALVGARLARGQQNRHPMSKARARGRAKAPSRRCGSASELADAGGQGPASQSTHFTPRLPISTDPKPMPSMASAPSAFLSNPAARPVVAGTSAGKGRILMGALPGANSPPCARKSALLPPAPPLVSTSCFPQPFPPLAHVGARTPA